MKRICLLNLSPEHYPLVKDFITSHFINTHISVLVDDGLANPMALAKAEIVAIFGETHKDETDFPLAKKVITFAPLLSIINTNEVVTQFDKLVKTIENYCVEGVQQHTGQVEITDENYLQCISYIKKRAVGKFFFVYDTETMRITSENALNIYRTDFRATVLGFTFDGTVNFVLPTFHMESKISEANSKKILDILNRYCIMNEDCIVAGHNIKFDLHVAYKAFGWVKRGLAFDTQHMLFLLHNAPKAFNNFKSANSLKDWTDYYLPYFQDYEQALKGLRNAKTWFPDGGRWANLPLDMLIKYNAIDVRNTFLLLIHILPKLQEVPDLYRFYRNYLSPLNKMFFYIERNGFKVNLTKFKEALAFGKGLEEQLKTQLLNFKIVKNFQQRKLEFTEKSRTFEFNPSSPVQLSELLYSNAGYTLPKIKDKDGKVGGTGEEVIKNLVEGAGKSATKRGEGGEKAKEALEFLHTLLKYRGVCKTNSTYLTGLEDVLSEDGKLHTLFNLIGTETGRISCTGIYNLMNITKPSKIEDAEEKRLAEYIREIFIPDGDDALLYQLDYSQAELRLMMECAGDKVGIEAYKNGVDLHALTAANNNGMSLETFLTQTKEFIGVQRFYAKGSNFGLIYDASVYAYMMYLKSQFKRVIDKNTANKEHEAFFKTYSALRPYYQKVSKETFENGYIDTLLGYRNWVSQSTNPINLKSLYRTAINSRIQGTGAQLCLLSMLLYWKDMGCPKKELLNHIHDSNMLQTKNKERVMLLQTYMETIDSRAAKYFPDLKLSVAMKADIEVGETWQTLKPL